MFATHREASERAVLEFFGRVGACRARFCVDDEIFKSTAKWVRKAVISTRPSRREWLLLQERRKLRVQLILETSRRVALCRMKGRDISSGWAPVGGNCYGIARYKIFDRSNLDSWSTRIGCARVLTCCR
jgi:hypothetical protein